MIKKKRLLSLAVMTVLLSGVSTAWANTTPPNADETITSSNNESTSENRYDRITGSLYIDEDPIEYWYVIKNAGTVYVSDGAEISGTGGPINDQVIVFGVCANQENNTVEVNGNVNIAVTANSSENRATGYGLYAYSKNNTINGDATIKVKATAEQNGISYGLRTANGGNNTINGSATIEVEATGGGNASSSGLEASGANSTNKITGDVIIKTKATVQQSGKSFEAYALKVVGRGVNDLSSTGTLKQLEGDVYVQTEDVINYKSGSNKLVMDTPKSYLQGNLLQTTNSHTEITNRLTISNGATWRPVYDNRYGSFNNKKDNTSGGNFANTYAVNAIATTINDAITLSDDGVIDLTWDATSRSRSFRTLTLYTFAGTNGIFRINTDLANNNADKITLNSADSGSTVKIQVNYDPYFATNPNVGASITGAAGVLDGTAANTITVVGAESEYNAYKFTPTIAWNSTNSEWEITNLHTDYAPPAVTTNVMTAADSRMVMNEMWQADTNSLNKRLGELRSTKPEGGIWARYGHGKVESGQGRAADVKYNLFQVGYDKASTTDSDSQVYRGLAVTHTKGDSSYETGSG